MTLPIIYAIPPVIPEVTPAATVAATQQSATVISVSAGILSHVTPAMVSHISLSVSFSVSITAVVSLLPMFTIASSSVPSAIAPFTLALVHARRFSSEFVLISQQFSVPKPAAGNISLLSASLVAFLRERFVRLGA